jgi:hypothetical protein
LLLLHIVDDSVGGVIVASEICNQKLGGGMAVEKTAIMVLVDTLFFAICDVLREARGLSNERL